MVSHLGDINKLEDVRHRLGIRHFVSVFGTSLGEYWDVQNNGVPATLLDSLISELLKEGVAVLNGGYQGTMSSLAKAIVNKGGLAVGVAAETIPDSLLSSNYSELLIVRDHWTRLSLLVQEADSIIVLPGGIGTLTEISSALWLMDRKLITQKPIIYIGDYWKDILDSFNNLKYSYRYGNGQDLVFVNDENQLSELLNQAFHK